MVKGHHKSGPSSSLQRSMENELRPILCTAMSPRRCKRLTGVKLALPKRDPFRKPPSFGSSLSAELERAAAAVSAFRLKWIPSQMAARLYTHRHQANGHWRGQSVGSSVIPKTLTDFVFQYLSTGVAPFYKNLLSTPQRSRRRLVGPRRVQAHRRSVCEFQGR